MSEPHKTPQNPAAASTLRRVAKTLSAGQPGESCRIHGWIRTRREAKNVYFVEINDGSCLSNLQAVISLDDGHAADQLERLHTGASIELEGKLVESPGKGQRVELSVSSFAVVGDAPPETYPLQKKRHSFEYLREIAHLRPRTNTFGAVTRVRNAASMAVHHFFQNEGFLYLHSPIITASDAEGAGALFQVTTLDIARASASGATIDYTKDFFGKPSYLTVSGQLNAEIFACAMERVYTFGPTFRAEQSNTTRHLAEFWMIEPELAFCALEGNMELAEKFLKSVIGAVLRECSEDMAFFDLRIEKGLIEALERLVNSNFTHMTYTDAVKELESSGRNFEYTVTWGADLQSEHEKFLTEEVVRGPIIVTDYPKEIKAFYMKLNEDEKTVRAMDVLVPRLGEIIGGSQREERGDVLERRMQESGLDPAVYWWYLDLRRFGTVPHSGFGLGFERLLQYVTGMQNIRDVIPFPRTPRSAEF